MPRATSRSTPTVHQLKVTLREVKPPIWRRLLIPSSFTLGQVHNVVNEAMGWFDSHLHQFTIDGEVYGMSDPFGDLDLESDSFPEDKVKLTEVLPMDNLKARYEYDFGDGWEHDIVVEAVLPAEKGVQYPLCLAGKRACPPEDCGGPGGYYRLLEIIADPTHEEYESMVEWLGPGFEAERFSVAEVNELLKAFAQPARKRKGE